MSEEIKTVEEIWKENEEIADKLADCYYDSILEEYKDYIKNDSKENLGFNAFADGIRVGLDIVIPLLDKNMNKIVEEKISSMIEKRTKINKENERILKVNCSYCGKEIECHEDMIKAEKHMCFSCFKKLGNEIKPEDIGSNKVHVDIPIEKLKEEIPSLIASGITKKSISRILEKL